jgi:benzylsuccinate CoA-transferase BbsE subunit
MCSITPFGQSGPWKDYLSSDLLHLAAGGQMAGCGYSENDYPDAPPIAGGGGQSWHMGSHYGNIAICAALMYRSVTGIGQYIDTSVHDSCALTTEAHVTAYIYKKLIVRRQTGRHASPTPSDPTQIMCKDGKYLNGGVNNRVTVQKMTPLVEWMKEYGLQEDLSDKKYLDPDIFAGSKSHINDVVSNFLSNITRDEAYHGFQRLGINSGAVRSPEEVMQDPHLDDRDYWEEVEYPELGINIKHPGPGGIFKGSPWKISRRAPFVGEHTNDILSNDLTISQSEIDKLSKNKII